MQYTSGTPKTNHSRCVFCGQTIFWFKSRNDKFYPCDSNRSNDFHQCRRRGNQSPRAERHESGEVAGMIERIIQAGYRALALALHPDRGGCHEDMIALNAAIECLRKAVR